MKIWAYIAAIMILLASCEKRQLDDCITSRGPERTETRQVPTFHQIKLQDKFDVILMQDENSPESVTLIGGMNLFDGIDTKVKNGVLIVEDNNTCNFVRSFKEKVTVIIQLKKIDRLEINAVAGVNTEGVLNLDDLDIIHSGLEDVNLNLNVANQVYLQSINSGGLFLKGNARKIKGSIEEISLLDARHLACEQAYIDSHTRLDCYINPSKILYVKIYNEGNIWYLTEPSDQKELNVHTGSGQLLFLDL